MEIRSASLRELHDYWSRQRGRSLPLRGTFTPDKMRTLIGGLSLIDIHYELLRFFYRLDGTKMSNWLGFDLTNKFLDQCPDGNWARIASRHLTEIVDTGEPSVMWHREIPIAGFHWSVEALGLPLSRTGEALDMLISATVHNREVVGHLSATDSVA